MVHLSWLSYSFVVSSNVGQNTDDVRLNCDGVSVMHISAPAGMTEADFAAVLSWVEVLPPAAA